MTAAPPRRTRWPWPARFRTRRREPGELPFQPACPCSPSHAHLKEARDPGALSSRRRSFTYSSRSGRSPLLPARLPDQAVLERPGAPGGRVTGYLDVRLLWPPWAVATPSSTWLRDAGRWPCLPLPPASHPLPGWRRQCRAAPFGRELWFIQRQYAALSFLMASTSSRTRIRVSKSLGMAMIETLKGLLVRSEKHRARRYSRTPSKTNGGAGAGCGRSPKRSSCRWQYTLQSRCDRAQSPGEGSSLQKPPGADVAGPHRDGIEGGPLQGPQARVWL